MLSYFKPTASFITKLLNLLASFGIPKQDIVAILGKGSQTIFNNPKDIDLVVITKNNISIMNMKNEDGSKPYIDGKAIDMVSYTESIWSNFINLFPRAFPGQIPTYTLVYGEAKKYRDYYTYSAKNYAVVRRTVTRFENEFFNLPIDSPIRIKDKYLYIFLRMCQDLGYNISDEEIIAAHNVQVDQYKYKYLIDKIKEDYLNKIEMAK